MSIKLIIDEDAIIDALCHSESVNLGYVVGCLTGMLTNEALISLIQEYHEELAMREEDAS